MINWRCCPLMLVSVGSGHATPRLRWPRRGAMLPAGIDGGMHMGRTLLGAVVGLVFAVATVMLIEFAGHQVFPPPAGLDPMVAEDMAKIIQALPIGAMVFVVAAWVIGAFDGGFVAALIARNGHPRAAAVVPALMVMAGVVGMIVKMPGHPQWMAVVGLLLAIPAALAGAWLAGKGRRTA